MQIGPFDPSTFPTGGAPTVPTSSQNGAAGIAGGRGDENAPPALAPKPVAVGVVLRLQSEMQSASAIAGDHQVVYSDRTGAATANDGQSEIGRMAIQHAQALQHTAGTSTRLTLDKDGVLVARPAVSGETKAQEFVHHAVAAMREHAEAQARHKAAGKMDDSASGGSLIPRSLAEVQKLASRFKLFA